MSTVAIVAGPPEPILQTPDERLHKTALQLEGLFVQRLFAAMRDTVPDDGPMSAGSAESTFTSMLDEKFAEQVPTQWNGSHSLARALFNQLRQRLAPPAADPAGTGNPSPAR